MDPLVPAKIFDDDYLWFYEELLDEDRNRSDTDEIIETLGLAPGSRVLDAPCGHGRIANLLAAAGFAVTGVDLTELFLDRAAEEARELGVEVEYLQGDLRQLPVDGPFDAVVCWFTSFGYFDDEGNRAVLDEYARVLRPGGTLLIDTIHHDGFVRGFTRTPRSLVTRRGNDLMVDTTDFDPHLGRLVTERTIVRDGTTRDSGFSIRLPTVPEFDAWLEASGFGERRFATRGGEPLELESFRLVVTAVR